VEIGATVEVNLSNAPGIKRPKRLRQVKLGVASHQDVWIVDAAMYGLTSSPRDWSDHRDKIIPTMVWHREEGGIKWRGSFKKATDQHLWHLKEECLETGESRHRGTMAIYVDDVLLAAEDAVAVSALQSIAAVWECADAVQATFHEPVGFCGFEIQQNEAEHGGGYRLHQLSNPDTPTPQRTRATLDMLDMDIFSRSADMSMSTCIF